MAIYHLSAQIIKRSEGRSAIVAAAYRAGERLTDRETGMVADYRNKGGIVHTEIRTPANAPAWMQDRETLWNVLEYKSRRVDSQLAREMNIALPRELPFEQQKALLQRFVDDQFIERGMVADFAIHHDEENNNPHAHVMLSFYAANENGFRRTRTREWNSKSFLQEVRASWCAHANSALIAIGSEERIDHRTLVAQGIDRRPTIHEGPNNRKAWDKGHRPASNVVDIRTYAGRKRELHYPEIDAGRTRAQYNVHVLAFNERQVSRRIGEAMDAIDGWMRHRFLEASIKRTGLRLRDARRSRRSAEGSIKVWTKILKARQRASMLSRVFENRPRRLARIVRQIGIAERRLKDAKRRQAVARQQELTAEREYRQAKLAMGRDRQERKERRQRSVARWTAAVGRVAPESIRIDRLPEGRQDRRWGEILRGLAEAARRHPPPVRQTVPVQQMPEALEGDQQGVPAPTPQGPGDDREFTHLPGPEAAGPQAESNKYLVEEIPAPTAVEIALAARAAVDRQTARIERMDTLETRISRLERMVRSGQASPEELAQAKQERVEVREAAGGDEAWQRHAEMRAGYADALDKVEITDIRQAEISETEREALVEAKQRREERLRQEAAQRQGLARGGMPGLQHKIT
ncbi:MAG: MobQ family relaxase [Gammaproteobacteria bacterium]